jgi:hypothetical protein
MAQADQTVQNATFPTVRADINSNLAALFSDSSGNGAPTVTVAFQDWIDTSGTDPLWKKRNAANNAWITVATIDGNDIAFEGTLPDQSGESGKYLSTDGTDASWASITAAGQLLRAPQVLTSGVPTPHQQTVQAFMWKRLAVVAVVAALTALAVAVAVVPVDIAQNTLPLSLQSAIPMRSAQVGLLLIVQAAAPLLLLAVQLLQPGVEREGLPKVTAVLEAPALMVILTSPVAVEDLDRQVLVHQAVLGVIPSLAVVHRVRRLLGPASQAHQVVGDLE